MPVPRIVSPEQDADRRAAYAVSDCSECAADIVKMTPQGFVQWLRKVGLRAKGPCLKRPVKARPSADPTLNGGVVLEREPYILWLQQALAKERAEATRLRRALISANSNLARIIERPAENDPGPAPTARLGSRAPIEAVVAKPTPKPGLDPAKKVEPGDPLTRNEHALLRALLSCGGKQVSTRIFDVMPRRGAHWASISLKHRGLITVRPGIGEGENPASSIYQLTDKGRETAQGLAEAPPA